MRKIVLSLAALASLAAPLAYAQSGPKMGKDGGIGSSTSTYSAGEPTGGTYAINGTTGDATFNSVTVDTPIAVTSGGTGASSASGARTALGLGTAATQNTGTSGANVPLLNGANTWGAAQNISSSLTASGTITAGNGNVALDRQGTGLEGGQVTFGYGNGVAGDWITDVDVGNNFRLIKADGSGTIVALTIPPATGELNLATPLPVSSGGTGAASATAASDNLQFTPGGTGSAARSITSKFKETRSATDFSGCDPTGAVDSTTCFTNALASFGTGGGTLLVSGKFLLDSSLTIPAGVSLLGQCKMPGTNGTNASAPYGDYNCGVLMVNSAASINMSAGSNLTSLLIYRAGMTFPPANSSAFAGTAVTAAGDDVSLMATQIMGFNKAFYSDGYQRARIEYLYSDNTNGVEITDALDVPYISHSHFWPFSNIGVGGSYTNITRSGKCIYLHDTVDWPKLDSNFCWGYNRGVVLENVNSATVIGGGADNAFSGVPLNTGSIGLEVLGTSTDTNVVGFQAAAQETAGIHIDTTGSTMLTNSAVWGGSSHAILIDAGDTTVTGGILGGLAGVSNGISISSGTPSVSISGVKFGTISGNPINLSAANSNLRVGVNNYGSYSGVVAGSNFTTKSIASADPLPVLPGYDSYVVTGTTNFGGIKAGITGQTITLVFTGSLSVFSSTGSATAVHLLGGATFAAGANSTLTLRYINGQWYEIGRS